jgi:hypothetical protein
MPPKKKTDTPATNVNNNHNTNNITLNVEHPKPQPITTKKPNWVVKTIIVGAIGLILSLTGYFIKAHFDEQSGDAPEIHNNKPIPPNN